MTFSLLQTNIVIKRTFVLTQICEYNVVLTVADFFMVLYAGPKLFKQLESKSNKNLIKNAVMHSCLPGKVNESVRNKTLKVRVFYFYKPVDSETL